MNSAEFKYLPKEMLTRMLGKRMQDEDCNAGAIFDNLTSENWPDQKFAIELICETLPRQNVEVVLFKFNKEDIGKDGESQDAEVCTNYRFFKRHDPAHKATEEVAVSSADDAKPKKAAVKTDKKGGKGGKGEETQNEAQLKAQKEAEEAKRDLEDEISRKRAEEQARAGYKAKEYTDEEKETWDAYKADIEQFFAQLIMKASDAEAADGEKEEVSSPKSGAAPAEADAAEEEQKKGDDEEEKKSEAEGEEPAEKEGGERYIREQNIQYDFDFLCRDIRKIVPEPQWPDPDNEPLPPPVINSILRKPQNRNERAAITNFSIWTPLTEEEIAKQAEEAAANEDRPNSAGD